MNTALIITTAITSATLTCCTTTVKNTYSNPSRKHFSSENQESNNYTKSTMKPCPGVTFIRYDDKTWTVIDKDGSRHAYGAGYTWDYLYKMYCKK